MSPRDETALPLSEDAVRRVVVGEGPAEQLGRIERLKAHRERLAVELRRIGSELDQIADLTKHHGVAEHAGPDVYTRVVLALADARAASYDWGWNAGYAAGKLAADDPERAQVGVGP